MKHGKFMSKGNRSYEPQKPKVSTQGVPNIPSNTQAPAQRADSGGETGPITPATEPDSEKITLLDIMVEAVASLVEGDDPKAAVQAFATFLRVNRAQVQKHPTTVRSAGTQLSGQLKHACAKVEVLYQQAVDQVLSEAHGG
jgi:hypothetical protein